MTTVTVTVDHQAVHIHLSGWQRLFGLFGDQTVPLASITAVEVVERAADAVRGVRAPGTAVWRRVLLGTWRRRGSKQFVAARWSDRAVHLHARDQPFESYLVTVTDPDALAARIRERLPAH